MSDKSIIRTWNGEAATFIEQKKDGAIVVTVGSERRELPADEWERLPEHKGEVDRVFNKTAEERKNG